MEERYMTIQFQLPQDTWLEFKNLRHDKGYRSYREYIEKELLKK